MSSAPKSFALLIATAKTGASDVLGDLLQRNWSSLRNQAKRHLSRYVKAKVEDSDLVQETCLDLLMKLPKLKGESPGELVVWLRRSLIHHVQNTNKHFADTDKCDVTRERPLGEHIAEHLPARPSDEREDRVELLWKILGRLSANDQLVLILHYFEGMPFKDIGPFMRRSECAAQKLCNRAVRHCRTQARLLAASNN
jgi:RNA polymerase sigma factor (sigma-70 family)